MPHQCPRLGPQIGAGQGRRGGMLLKTKTKPLSLGVVWSWLPSLGLWLRCLAFSLSADVSEFSAYLNRAQKRVFYSLASLRKQAALFRSPCTLVIYRSSSCPLFRVLVESRTNTNLCSVGSPVLFYSVLSRWHIFWILNCMWHWKPQWLKSCS